MGVLFGLAMDYEMFLVSAMREEYVQSGDPTQAVHRGFRASAKVVTAAALIMSSVFVAFIPGGSATIKPIALGLAVGVFVDAFVVRMTLVPAVLVLLGTRAWWLPGWLDRLLPEVDVEGAALHRKVDFESWESEHGVAAVLASDLVVHVGEPPVDVVAAPGPGDYGAWRTRPRQRAGGPLAPGRRPAAGGRAAAAGAARVREPGGHDGRPGRTTTGGRRRPGGCQGAAGQLLVRSDGSTPPGSRASSTSSRQARTVRCPPRCSRRPWRSPPAPR